MADGAASRSLLLFFGIVDSPKPPSDIDGGEHASFGEGIVGGNLARGVERGGLDHDKAAVHGHAVFLGEGTGKDERFAEALQIGEMLRAGRHAQGQAVRLVGADQRIQHHVSPCPKLLCACVTVHGQTSARRGRVSRASMASSTVARPEITACTACAIGMSMPRAAANSTTALAV